MAMVATVREICKRCYAARVSTDCQSWLSLVAHAKNGKEFRAAQPASELIAVWQELRCMLPLTVHHRLWHERFPRELNSPSWPLTKLA